MQNSLTQPSAVYEPPLMREVGGFAEHTLGVSTTPFPEGPVVFTFFV